MFLELLYIVAGGALVLLWWRADRFCSGVVCAAG